MGAYEVSDEEIQELVAASQAPHIAAKRERAVQQLFEEAVQDAAAEIISIARGSLNDKLRFEAAKYVVERVHGRLGDVRAVDGNHWENVLSSVYKEPSKYELEGGTSR